MSRQFFVSASFVLLLQMCATVAVAKSHHVDCNTTSAIATPNSTAFSCTQSKSYSLTITSKGGDGILLRFESLTLEADDRFLLLQNASDEETAIYILRGPLKDTFTYFVSSPAVTISMDLASDNKIQRTVKGNFYTGCREDITGQERIHRLLRYQETNGTTRCTMHIGAQEKQTYYRATTVRDMNLGGKSSLEIQGIEFPYNQGQDPVPFELIGSNYTLVVHLDQSIPNQTFTLLLDNVHKGCSGMKRVKPQDTQKLNPPTPVDSLNLTDVSCRWVLESQEDSVLGMTVQDFDLTGVQDSLVVTDGGTEDSPPIAQAFQSDSERIKGLVMRSSGRYLWVSLTLSQFTTRDIFTASVSAHAKGGRMHNEGSVRITTDDTAFFLEVDPNKQVLLSVPEVNMKAGAHVLVYTDFFRDSLLLQDVTSSSPKYPIVSMGHRLLLLSSGFKQQDTFKTTFTGVERGCHSVTLGSSGFYSLSGHCNSSCSWLVHPQEQSKSKTERLLVSLSHLNLGAGGSLSLGTPNQQALLTVNGSASGVPPVELDVSEGAYVKINRSACSASDVNSTAVVGVASTISGESAIPELQLHTEYQFHSPRYPNQYPLNANQSWQFNRNKAGGFHLTFKSFDIRPGHSLVLNSGAAVVNLTGSNLPRDFVVVGPKLMARFVTPIVAPYSSGYGFHAVLTPSDFVQDVLSKSGVVETPSYPAPVKSDSLFYWSVAVPVPDANKTSAAVWFTVSYNVSSVPKNITDFLHVYDGDSVRSPRIMNLTGENVLSRTSMILVKYISSVHSAGIPIRINFTAYYCNKSDTCHHSGNCIHVDWRCNGVDDCGDNTDELDCGSQPIPPSPSPAPTTTPAPSQDSASSGVSKAAFAITVIVALALGIVGTLVAPVLVRRYRAYRYSRFSSVSVSE